MIHGESYSDLTCRPLWHLKAARNPRTADDTHGMPNIQHAGRTLGDPWPALRGGGRYGQFASDLTEKHKHGYPPGPDQKLRKGQEKRIT